MKAVLKEPSNDKNWRLEFTGLPLGETTRTPGRSLIWSTAQQIGSHFCVSPFLQGDSEDWMLVEFWCSCQGYILEACMHICQQLGIELEL